MEKFIVKVRIETQDGKLVKEETFDTANIAEVKAFGSVSIVDKFVEDTLDEIRENRRENPHHHQNRLD
jgi:hypothetical protein